MQQKDKYPDKRNSIIIVIALVLLLLCLLIYALGTWQPIQVVDCLPAPSNAPQSADGHFVDQQLIVMGPRDQLHCGNWSDDGDGNLVASSARLRSRLPGANLSLTRSHAGEYAIPTR